MPDATIGVSLDEEQAHDVACAAAMSGQSPGAFAPRSVLDAADALVLVRDDLWRLHERLNGLPERPGGALAAQVPAPRPLRPLTAERLSVMVLYTEQVWLAREEEAVIAAALDEAQADCGEHPFGAAGRVLAALARSGLKERTARLAAWVGAVVLLHQNRRPAPSRSSLVGAAELAAAVRAGAVSEREAAEELRALWSSALTEHDGAEETR